MLCKLPFAVCKQFPFPSLAAAPAYQQERQICHDGKEAGFIELARQVAGEINPIVSQERKALPAGHPVDHIHKAPVYGTSSVTRGSSGIAKAFTSSASCLLNASRA